MARIKHISLNAEDPRALAEFYKSAFGLQELEPRPGVPVIYLTDGYIQFVILNARGQKEGVDHFGFEVEDVDAATAAAQTAAGEKWKEPWAPPPGGYTQLHIYDTVGQMIDLGTDWGL